LPIFKITKNASKDDYSEYEFEYDERGERKRRRINEYGEYETCSDFTDD